MTTDDEQAQAVQDGLAGISRCDKCCQVLQTGDHVPILISGELICPRCWLASNVGVYEGRGFLRFPFG